MNSQTIGKYLAYVLRHRPEELGIELDRQGWTDVGLLLGQLQAVKGWNLEMADLERVVAEDSKGRYAMRKGKIRANQGHSVAVQAFESIPVEPPATLYHGTTEQRFDRIRKAGALLPMQRHHVHLSPDLATARNVGSRHRGEQLLVLAIDAERMQQDGLEFYRSENDVYLTDRVPVVYVRKL